MMRPNSPKQRCPALWQKLLNLNLQNYKRKNWNLPCKFLVNLNSIKTLASSYPWLVWFQTEPLMFTLPSRTTLRGIFGDCTTVSPYVASSKEKICCCSQNNVCKKTFSPENHLKVELRPCLEEKSF